jgi:hypothetical protein
MGTDKARTAQDNYFFHGLNLLIGAGIKAAQGQKNLSLTA